MSLGHALLHRNDLEAALVAKPQKRGLDAAMEMLCAALGLGEVPDAAFDMLNEQVEAFEGFFERLQDLVQPGQPLAGVMAFVQIDFESPEDIADLFVRLCDFLETAEGTQIRAVATPLVDALLQAVPDVDLERLATFATARLDAVIDVLKAPLRRGRKDVAAIRAYRAAMTLRCHLAPLYGGIEAAGEFSLRAMLRGLVVDLLVQLDGIDMGPLRAILASVKGDFGGLIRAIFTCAGGGGLAAGAETMADEGYGPANDIQAAPHSVTGRPLLWTFDLVTNAGVIFNLIWEYHRTQPAKDRPFDAAMMIIGIIWEVTRWVLRAMPDKVPINRPLEGANEGEKLLNWFFTDMGNMVVHLFLRLWIPVAYENCADTNWALMLAARWIQWLNNSFNFRFLYQFLRSIQYFADFKAHNGNAENDDLETMPLGRLMMGSIGPIWLISLITGAAMPWEDFEVESWGGEYALFLCLPIGVWLLSHFMISGIAGTGVYGSAVMPTDFDPWLFGSVLGPMILIFVAMWITVSGLESDAQSLAQGALLGIFLGLAVFLVVLFGLWLGAEFAPPDNPVHLTRSISAFGFLLSLIGTAVLGALCSVFWWFTIDDSRDKEEVYNILDVGQTPYKLPMPEGENWFCGQGFHGVFSHLYSSAGNHYAVDLNECPGKRGTASRDAIVVTVTQGNPTDLDDGNTALLVHSAWAPNADPGSEDERVLTYSNYVHMQENGVHVRPGQRVPQGMHITDIDSTGRSALHHTHFAGMTAQRRYREEPEEDEDEGDLVRTRESMPILFGDESLKIGRNYLFLRPIKGKGVIEGKPISFAFYVSDNALAAPLPVATTVQTESATVDIGGTATAHSHRLIIDRRVLDGGDEIPEEVTLRTTVEAGHSHEVTLSRAQLAQVFALDAPSGGVTDEELGHSHTLGKPLIFEGIRYRTTDADTTVTLGSGDTETATHSHSLDVGLDQHLNDPAPPGDGVTFALSRYAYREEGSEIHAHGHDLTLDEAAFRQLQGIADLGIDTGGPVADTGTTPLPSGPAHTHELRRTLGFVSDPGGMTASVIEPPSGRLTARNPAPYDVLGSRMVLRVNERSTEWYLWAGERARAVADIAVDGGVQPGGVFQIGPGGADSVTVPTGGGRLSPQDSATALSVELRAPDPGPQRTVVVRAEPVLVIETRRRGTDAVLELGTGGTWGAAQLPVGAPAVARGSGAFADLSAVPLADLATHVDDMLRNGWTAPPGGVATGMTGGEMSLTVGGGTPAFDAGGPRVARVADALYRPGTDRFASEGPMPLAAERLGLAAGVALPLLATPARLAIPVPAAGARVEVAVEGRGVVLAVADADAAAVARQIMDTVAGVRAWPEGGQIMLETLAAGSNAALSVTVDGGGPVSASGVSPAGLGFGDLTAILPDEFRALVQDGIDRFTVPAAVSGANARANVDGNRLRIETDDTAAVALSALVATGDAPLAFGGQAEAHVLLSDAIGDPLSFDGTAWIDLDVAGELVRIPLDGASARLDIAPDGLPDAGETLEIAVNGAAPTVITFNDQPADMAATAAVVADVLGGEVTVRIAHRLVVEDMLWGGDGDDIDPMRSAGTGDMRALAGFLADLPVTATPRLAQGRDMLALSGLIPDPVRVAGQPVALMTMEVETDASGDNRIAARAIDPGDEVVVVVEPGADPLGFAPDPADPSGLISVPVDDATDLGANGVRYAFSVRRGGVLLGQGFAQLSAQPAMARATRAAQLPLPGSDTTLRLVVTAPGGDPLQTDIDLAGLDGIDAVAARINTACPHLRAWVARLPEAPAVQAWRPDQPQGPRLHVETVGGGTGWTLSLRSAQVAAALGFADTDAALDFTGRGDFADGAAAEADDLLDSLIEAADTMTGADNPAGAQNRISLDAIDGRIELRSAEGPLEVIAEPPELADQITVDVQPDVVRLGPVQPAFPLPATRIAVDSGRLLLRAGGRGLAAVEIFGGPAVLEAQSTLPAAPDPADLTEMLDAMRATPIRLRINGALRTFDPLPAAVTTIEGAVAHLAAQRVAGGWQGDDWWIGLVDEAGGARRCVIQTLRRGTNARLQLDLSTFPAIPALGILGFTGDPATGAPVIDARGPGNLPDLDTVSVANVFSSLRVLVQDAIERGGARQAVYTADVDDSGGAAATQLTVRPNLSTGVIAQTGATLGPGDHVLAASPTVATTLTVGYADPRPTPPGVAELISAPGAVTARIVRSIVHGEPARIDGFILPTALNVLNGRVLALTVDGTAVDITLSADAGTHAMDILRQIEAGSGWRVRGRPDLANGRFALETLMRGAAARLELRDAGGNDAVTGDPATGLSGPAPATASGSGSVSRLDAVSAQDYADVLNAGMIGEFREVDESDRSGFAVLEGSVYDAPERDLSDPAWFVRPLPMEFARIVSQRSGAAASVLPFEVPAERLPDPPGDRPIDLPAMFGWDRTLERGPATRAALRIPPFGEQPLSGRLHIQFNENAGVADLPPTETVVIDVPARDYDPPRLARVIRDQLFDAGLGAAQVYADGSIMVETSALGLGGTVRIPASGTPDADLGLAETLLPGGGFARGWPGAGRRPGPVTGDTRGSVRLPGFRSRPDDPAAAAIDWRFQAPDGREASYSAAAGTSLATIAADLDAALASARVPSGFTPPSGVTAPAQGRIGLAAIGDDGALYVEGLDFPRLDVDGLPNAFSLIAAIPVDEPPRVGGTPERREEPAVGLRRTHEARTIRILRDRHGRDVAEQFDDLGWIRLPADQETGDPQYIFNLPGGRFLSSLRVDAAKSDDYGPAAAMVRDVATQGDDPARPVVLSARYWLAWSNADFYGLAFDSDGAPMLVIDRDAR